MESNSMIPNGNGHPTLPIRSSKRTASLMGIEFLGTGSFVPQDEVTNFDLQDRFGFDPEWIKQRTGILSRRHASPDCATSDLCVKAAERAIRDSGVKAEEIDLVVVGTFTPDYSIPSTACLVQDRLGLDAAAIELQAACAGFMYALVTAAQYVASGNSALALVISGDCNSRIVNPSDQRTAPLFGDGAGAVLIRKSSQERGILRYQLGADGRGGPMLDRKSGGSRRPPSHADIDAGLHFLQMDGKNVFKWAVRVVEDTINLVVAEAGLQLDDVSLFLMHQANIRIIDHAVEALGLPRERVFVNLHRYGNTSGGSIPLALDEARQQGLVRRGDAILMCGFGAGLTWGTALVRW